MNKCKDCNKYLEFYGHDIKCGKHRKKNDDGYYLVGCRRCDDIIRNFDMEDSFCGSCV